MTRATIAGGVFAIMLVLLALATGYLALERDGDPALVLTRFLHPGPEHDADPAAATSPAETSSTAGTHEGLLYGRVITDDGETYEGRLRWGGDEEALWGNYFNGFRDESPWAAYAPPERRSIGAFGIEIAVWERQRHLRRPLMVRFGDIAYIEPRGDEIRVVLRSDTEVVLDRFAADDLADGLRVWDVTRGVVDIGEWRIRIIEFLPTPTSGIGPYPLHGTVRTRQGDFTGLVQWDRQQCVGSDELHGNTADGELSPRFDTIGSIARRSPDSSLVTLLDGGEIVLSGTREVGSGNRGIYVDDHRYGRVLISWDTFERVDFSPGGTGPAYDDFPPGQPLTGSVTTRSGRRLSGRLVYDLDESETTETLDAPSQGVDYTILFGLIASIVPGELEERGAQRARVTLHSGEELQLERTGDLGEGNAGMLIFVNGRQSPEYVPWTDVEQVDFDRPPEMSPPDGPR